MLILDNAHLHDTVSLTTLQQAGIPPYSTDLNPIDDGFSVGSNWLRRHISPEQYNE